MTGDFVVYIIFIHPTLGLRNKIFVFLLTEKELQDLDLYGNHSNYGVLVIILSWDLGRASI